MILTLDVGTTTFKGALFNDDGSLCTLESLPMSIVSNSAGVHECDPRQWSEALGSIAKKFSGIGKVRAIVVSGNGPTLVPVLSRPVCRDGILGAETGMAKLWLDRSSVDEAAEISKRIGSFVDPSFSLPKALNLYRNQRDVYDKTLCFVSSF